MGLNRSTITFPMNPTQPTRIERAEAIARCANMIAAFHKIEPTAIFTETQSKRSAVREARCMLIFHLHRCGMSYDRIGKLVHRSPEYCQRCEKDGVIRMMGEDRELIETLPRIPNSLQVERVEA
jgi:hypothetical protein